MTSPRELVAAECLRCGRDAFVEGCVRLVQGEYDDVALIRGLAPRSWPKFEDGGEHDDVYWFRVWGMRGLLWAWEDVAARHRVDEALDAVSARRGDSVPRVRAAAERTLVVLTSS